MPKLRSLITIISLQFIWVCGWTQAPSAEFSASQQSGCSPLLVTFSDLSTGNPTTYNWTFNGGSPATATGSGSKTVLFNTPGTYTIELTVSNSSGSDTETKTGYITVFEDPVVNFTEDATLGCIPFEVNFTDQTSGGATPYTYQWDFGDGSPNSNTANPTHTYASVGTYTVFLRVTDDNGCQDTLTKNNLITVSTPPSAAFTQDISLSCNSPETVTFTDNSTGSGLTYTWDFGDGNTSTSQNPSNIYNAFGNYDIELVVTDGSGCTDTATSTFQSAQITAAFTVDTTQGCEGTAFNFDTTGSVIPLGTASFSWDFGNGNTSTAVSPNNIVYNTAGTYSVSLIVSSSIAGCADTISQSNLITIHPTPNPGFIIGAGEDSACQVPHTVNFTDTTTGAVSQTWNFGDGNTGIGAAASNNYASFGTYTVNLTVNDANGCSATATASNLVHIIQPIVNFTSNINNGCEDLNVDFTDLSTSFPPINSWLWSFTPNTGISFTGGTNNTSQNPQVLFSDTGVYSVYLTTNNPDGCIAIDSSVAMIQVGMPTEAGFLPTSNGAPDTAGCHPFTIDFTDTSNTYADQWQWDFNYSAPNISSSSTSQNPTHIFNTDTGYFSVALISLHHGCPDTAIKDSLIFVQPAKPIFSFDNSVGCDTPFTINMIDASLAADLWLWDFGDPASGVNNTSTDTMPSHTYNSPGTYTVKLVTTNNTYSCVDSITNNVTISKVVSGFNTDTTVGCSPLTINFSDTSLTFPSTTISANWDFNGDSIIDATGTTQSNTFTTSGFHDVILISINGFGCRDTIRIDSAIDVKALPQAGFSSDTTNGCVPLTINYTDTSIIGSGTILQWIWDFDADGTPDDTSTTSATSGTYTTAGTFNVEVVLIDAFNCRDSVTFSNYITATAPIAGFSFVNNTICKYDSGSFVNNSTGAAQPLTSIWNFNDGSALDTATGPTHLFSTASDTTTSITIDLTVIDDNGCRDTVTDSIIISIPKADFTVDSSSAICPPLPVNFTNASSNDVLSWNWDFGDTINNSSVFTNPSHTYQFAGSYSILLEVTNADGCIDSVLKQNLINLSGPNGNFTSTTDSASCQARITFVGNVQNTDTIIWLFGDGSSDTTAINNIVNSTDSVSHTYSPGNYLPMIIISDTQTCVVQIIGNSVSIPTDNLSPSYAASLTTAYPEDIITFTDFSSSPNNIVSWSWNFGDSSTIINNSTDAQVNHQYSDLGTYTTQLQITDEGGCSDDTTLVITIEEGFELSSVFTPNGDGINDAFLIKRLGKKGHEITIYNRWGEIVFYENAPEVSWDGTTPAGLQAPEGTYYYVLITTSYDDTTTTTTGYLTLLGRN